MTLLNQVLHGAAEVSMVKLVLQSTAEVLHCMVAESREPPQRDKEHLDRCFYQALQDKSEVSMVKPVLQNTAEVSMLAPALHMTTEVNV